MRKIILIISLVAVVSLILGGLFFWNQINWPVSSESQEVLFTIADGVGAQEIADQLEAEGLIRSSFWFKAYVYLDRSERNFFVGSYVLNKDLSIKNVVNILTAGNTTPEDTIRLIEGWTTRDMADYLDERGSLSKNDFLTVVDTTDSRQIVPDKTYDFLVDKPSDQGLEGYLFPDTYRIYENSTIADIVERMLDNFGVKFTEQMAADARARGMNIHEIVTLASIIEKEVRTDADRKIAAGIFYERMAVGVPLQSDATVNYVTGKQALQPTLEDLDVDNLYNTYKYQGLPPGPISNPSLSSIMAAIYPTETDFFYFLTKPDGSTVFSKTFDEHLANKRLYLQ
ncbi:endolytic transglycosylase MltG [Patescibacteria group bacterium]|nr:endolytic transglycosylase MltG [Patescibacteria group bacterium]